ncbi:phosphodiester glycosidase family protein [Actinomyces polynesiensis]|uniref:phosphodiester glycosidase family protein n=1 Tax=Actinomyces polynesiensis TaxID=1325934 RepID=UPI0011CC4F48|nr:phosphodiester glycosidase family protein [Actinomyces polynesiensis]
MRSATRAPHSIVHRVLSGIGVVALVAATLPAAALAAAPRTPDGDVLGEVSTDSVAPGLEYTHFRHLSDSGWITGNLLEADLAEPTLQVDLQDPGTVAAVQTVSQQVAGDASVVAAVNGDFFDMNATNAPIGTDISAASGVRSISDSANALTLSSQGVAAIQRLTSTAAASFAGTSHRISAVNSPSLPADGLAYYTQVWGGASLDQKLADRQVQVALVNDGVVEDLLTAAQASQALPMASGSALLVGLGSSAATVGALTVGDPVDVSVGVDRDVVTAVSGTTLVLSGGQAVQGDATVAARTVVGLSQDGSRMCVLEVDGRKSDSLGITTAQAGELLRSVGAYTGLNLDGGGSSTMLVRASGTTAATVHNRPSDGSERPVANSLVFRSTASSTDLEDVRVSTTADGADTLLPGLSRSVHARGIAASGAGLDVTGTFSASGAGTVAEQSGNSAVIRAGSVPGTIPVAFTARGRSASTTLRVIGTLDHLSTSQTSVSLQDAGDTTTLTVTGHDADGRSALVEPRDLTISEGSGAATLTPADDGTLTVTGEQVGSDTFTLTVGGHSTQVTVTVGMEEKQAQSFADATNWGSEYARATGALAAAEGHEGNPGLRMTYDFTQSTATRGAYAILPSARGGSTGTELEGQPLELRLWIKGDGSGAWPRIQVVTGDGVTTNLDGPTITWTGWQQATFTVPTGTAYPLTLQRVRIMETRSTASYLGDITVSDLSVVVPPDSVAPVLPTVHDASVVTDGTVSERSLQIAVISDAQFTAAGGSLNEAIIANLRRSLRQIVAAGPDLVVIDGDLVDEANAATFALAEQILDEELTSKADVPWIWAPGNHEVMGNPISLFAQQEGAQLYSTQVLKRTRVTTLDSSRGTLHADGTDQLAKLRAQLDADADDPSVTGEVIVFHMPTEDYLPDKNSQLSDRTEAQAMDDMLAAWRQRTGKSVAVVNGHVGGFNARSFDGVTQLTNGNSGKGPAATADNGGFTGWTMLGVNPGAGITGDTLGDATARTRWLRAETHAHVDADADPTGGNGVVVNASATSLEVGQSASVAASVYQSGIGAITVAWPMSAQWGGQGVTVESGSVDGLERSAQVVRFNPDTGELTAVEPGTATLDVTVNGVTSSVEVTVAASSDGGDDEDGDGSQSGGDDGSQSGADEGGSQSGADDGSQSGADEGGSQSGPVDSSQSGAQTPGAGSGDPDDLARTGALALPVLVTALLVTLAGGLVLMGRSSVLRRR